MAASRHPRWTELCDHAAVSCDSDALAGLDPPDVAAEMVLELNQDAMSFS
jgi:hypothetical protein